MTMQKHIFRNQEIQRKFDVNGYVVLPVFNAEEVAALQQLYHKYYDGESVQGFHTLINVEKPEIRGEIYREITGYYRPKMEEYLVDYEPFISSFAIKEPGDSGRIPLHLDWAVVDEKEFVSLNNWSPLTDTDGENGCLCMLKGSHLHEFTYRGSNINFIAAASKGGSIMQEMVERYPVRPLRMKAGEMVLYSHKMAHFSMPNRSRKTRVAVSMVAIPKAAEALHYHLNSDGSISRFQSGSEFYLNHRHGSEPRFGLSAEVRIPASEIGRIEDQVTALIDLDEKVKAVLAN
jgi:ectoine hydroxylase-related dioxygenase (phytanoyl-CoA dioxygenase family)